LRKGTNICPPRGKFAFEVLTERIDGHTAESFWYEESADGYQYVRLFDIPGTLSGDILRLRQNLPDIKGDFEIHGETVRLIEAAPLPPEREDDTEDISLQLLLLPEVQVDEAQHHVKKGKYLSEVNNLLKCQSGSCSGARKSSHIIHLLGKSSKGELVFEKLLPRFLVLPRYCSVAIYKRWVQHMVAGLRCLHSLGIIHRDLHIENLLFTADGQNLVLGDVEGRWGQRSAPEISREDTLDAGWTEKSDIYDIGVCIKCIIYANIPVTSQVEWPIPPPFDRIVEACLRKDPLERPTLDELEAMLEEIEE
jgi:hypothetical protein